MKKDRYGSLGSLVYMICLLGIACLLCMPESIPASEFDSEIVAQAAELQTEERFADNALQSENDEAVVMEELLQEQEEGFFDTGVTEELFEEENDPEELSEDEIVKEELLQEEKEDGTAPLILENEGETQDAPDSLREEAEPGQEDLTPAGEADSVYECPVGIYDITVEVSSDTIPKETVVEAAGFSENDVRASMQEQLARILYQEEDVDRMLMDYFFDAFRIVFAYENEMILPKDAWEVNIRFAKGEETEAEDVRAVYLVKEDTEALPEIIHLGSGSELKAGLGVPMLKNGTFVLVCAKNGFLNRIINR